MGRHWSCGCLRGREAVWGGAGRVQGSGGGSQESHGVREYLAACWGSARCDSDRAAFSHAATAEAGIFSRAAVHSAAAAGESKALATAALAALGLAVRSDWAVGIGTRPPERRLGTAFELD